MIAYILLTYGEKHFPSGSLQCHPAARTQIANIEYYVRHLPAPAKITWVHDHARQIRTDDLGRLFRHVLRAHRQSFYIEFSPFESRLVGVRQRRLSLAEMPGRQKVQLIATESDRFVVTPHRSALTPEDRRQQTRAATAVSGRVRAFAADRRSHELQLLSDELQAERGPLSYAQLAEAANARGITTTRGLPWSRQAVQRALRRVQQVSAEPLVARANATDAQGAR